MSTKSLQNAAKQKTGAPKQTTGAPKQETGAPTQETEHLFTANLRRIAVLLLFPGLVLLFSVFGASVFCLAAN